MTVDEIIKQCNQSIGIIGEIAQISLIMPGKWGKRNSRRLCPGGPVGEIVSSNFDGPGIIVLFSAKEIKQFLIEQKEKED